MKKNKINKWYAIVVNLTWDTVKKHYNQKIRDKFSHIAGDEKVNLEKFSPLRGDCVVLSSFCRIAPAKRARLARASSHAQARGEISSVGKYCFVTDTERFTAWLDSLDKNALYKSLLRAHTAMKL